MFSGPPRTACGPFTQLDIARSHEKLQALARDRDGPIDSSWRGWCHGLSSPESSADLESGDGELGGDQQSESSDGNRSPMIVTSRFAKPPSSSALGLGQVGVFPVPPGQSQHSLSPVIIDGLPMSFCESSEVGIEEAQYPQNAQRDEAMTGEAAAHKILELEAQLREANERANQLSREGSSKDKEEDEEECRKHKSVLCDAKKRVLDSQSKHLHISSRKTTYVVILKQGEHEIPILVSHKTKSYAVGIRSKCEKGIVMSLYQKKNGHWVADLMNNTAILTMALQDVAATLQNKLASDTEMQEAVTMYTKALEAVKADENNSSPVKPKKRKRNVRKSSRRKNSKTTTSAKQRKGKVSGSRKKRPKIGQPGVHHSTYLQDGLDSSTFTDTADSLPSPRVRTSSSIPVMEEELNPHRSRHFSPHRHAPSLVPLPAQNYPAPYPRSYGSHPHASYPSPPRNYFEMIEDVYESGKSDLDSLKRERVLERNHQQQLHVLEKMNRFLMRNMRRQY